MFKKILISIIMIITVVGCFPVSAIAAGEQTTENTTIEYLEDGSYITTTITQTTISRSTTTSTAGTKTYTYYDSDDEKQWSYSIRGVFHYTGTSSSCVSVTDSYTITNDYWSMYGHSCSYSGKTAKGNITMRKKVLGIVTKTIDEEITLTCSATGVLS